MTVSAVARPHGVSPSLLVGWRQRTAEGCSRRARAVSGETGGRNPRRSAVQSRRAAGWRPPPRSLLLRRGTTKPASGTRARRPGRTPSPSSSSFLP